MEIRYQKSYSYYLNREMEYKIYGSSGKKCLFFPSQNGRFYEYEDRGMINSIKDLIESGKVQIFCVDAIDYLSFSSNKSPNEIIKYQEDYFNYVAKEFTPMINNNEKIMTFGVSLGAYQAMNLFLRRPDLVDMVLALSGIYQTSFFFGDYHNELTFLNSPIDSLAYIKGNNEYLDLYKRSKIYISVGAGAYEASSLAQTKDLEYMFNLNDIHPNFYYFDENSIHDWPSWLWQISYFFKQIF